MKQVQVVVEERGVYDKPKALNPKPLSSEPPFTKGRLAIRSGPGMDAPTTGLSLAAGEAGLLGFRV